MAGGNSTERRGGAVDWIASHTMWFMILGGALVGLGAGVEEWNGESSPLVTVLTVVGLAVMAGAMGTRFSGRRVQPPENPDQ